MVLDTTVTIKLSEAQGINCFPYSLFLYTEWIVTSLLAKELHKIVFCRSEKCSRSKVFNIIPLLFFDSNLSTTVRCFFRKTFSPQVPYISVGNI